MKPKHNTAQINIFQDLTASLQPHYRAKKEYQPPTPKSSPTKKLSV